MRIRSYCLAFLLLAFVGAAAHAAEPSPALVPVIAGAKQEGKLNLEWGSDILGGIEGAKAAIDGMNKMFGTSVTVRFTPGPSLPEVVNKIVISIGAGQPSPSDVAIGSDQHASDLWKKGASVPVDWAALLPGRIQPASIEADGRAIRIFTTLPGGIIYNTQRAPMKPEKLADLLRPEWKGKIASTPYAGSWELLAGSDVWGEKAVAFAEKLSPQLAGLMRCSELERIASGEFPGFAMDCTGRAWVELKRKGAPVEHVVPADFAAQRFYFFSLTRNAANPNAAKLFVTYLETPEGQKVVWKYAATDLHTYPDSELKPTIDAYEKRGITFHPFTIQWHLDHPEGQDALKKAIRILNGS
jgi:ABC-type Fe3+ transport system substrate-binding protein